MSWLYQPLLPGGAQLLSGAGQDDLTAADIATGSPAIGSPVLASVSSVRRGGGPLTEEELRELRKQDKRLKERLRKLQERKKQDQEHLRRLLRRAMGLEIAEEEAQEAQDLLDVIPAEAIAPHASARSEASVKALETHIAAISARVAELEAAIQRHQEEAEEEDDIETLLMMAA